MTTAQRFGYAFVLMGAFGAWGCASAATDDDGTKPFSEGQVADEGNAGEAPYCGAAGTKYAGSCTSSTCCDTCKAIHEIGCPAYPSTCNSYCCKNPGGSCSVSQNDSNGENYKCCWYPGVSDFGYCISGACNYCSRTDFKPCTCSCGSTCGPKTASCGSICAGLCP